MNTTGQTLPKPDDARPIVRRPTDLPDRGRLRQSLGADPESLVAQLLLRLRHPGCPQQHLSNLRGLKKFGLTPKTLTNVYRCTIESILWGCITAWYGNCTAHNRKALQRVVRSAQRITGDKHPTLLDTYSTRCHTKAKMIIKDINHPSHCLFPPLSSRRQGQYRCIKAGTERLKNSFYLKAIRLLNSHH